MKKAIIILISLIVLFVGGFFVYNFLYISEEKIVVDIEKEYEEYIQLIYDEQSEVTFIDQISGYVNIKFPIIRTRFNDELKCKVTYPDLKSYWIENQEELLKLEKEELNNKLLEVCGNAERKTVDITFPAKYDNGFLLLDSDCFEYKDAMSGGLQSLFVERYSEVLEEMFMEEEK